MKYWNSEGTDMESNVGLLQKVVPELHQGKCVES